MLAALANPTPGGNRQKASPVQGEVPSDSEAEGLYAGERSPSQRFALTAPFAQGGLSSNDHKRK